MVGFKKIDKNKQVFRISRKIINRICNTLRAGAYIETAAVVAGVSKPTLYAWIKRAHKSIAAGERGGLYIEFVNALERAQAESTVRDLLNIDKCAMGEETEFQTYPKGTLNLDGVDISGQIMTGKNGKAIPKKAALKPDWTASAWRLARKNPNEWGPKETISHKVDDGSVNINFVSKEEDEKTEDS